MSGRPSDETREEQTIREWLTAALPPSAPASLRQTLESVTRTSRPSRSSRSWSGGRTRRLLVAAAALIIVTVVGASIYIRQHSISAASSTPWTTDVPTETATPTPTAAPTLAAVSSWHLLKDALPEQQGEGGRFAPLIVARPGGGFAAFVQRFDDNSEIESQVFTSDDGRSWTRQSVVAGYVGGTAASGGMTLAVGCKGLGSDTASFRTWATTDFASWHETVLAGNPEGACLGEVVHGPAGFYTYAIAQGGPNGYWRSADGLTWTVISPTGLQWNDGGQLIAVPEAYAMVERGPNGPRILTSRDGATWTVAFEAPTSEVNHAEEFGRVVRARDGSFISFGFGDEGKYHPIWTSPDGLEWTESASQWTLPTNRIPQVIPYRDGYMAAVAGDVDTIANTVGPPSIWTSPDGVSWVADPLPAEVAKTHVGYAEVVSDGDHVVVMCTLDSEGAFLLVK